MINAAQGKMKNKRVSVILLPDNTFAVEFKTLLQNGELPSPRALHCCIKDKIVVTGIRISKEAAYLLYLGLQKQLQELISIDPTPPDFTK